MHERQQKIKEKLSALIQKANSIFNISLPDIEVRFDLRGRCAGKASVSYAYASCETGKSPYTIRFNVDLMTSNGWDHMLNNTVPHELAHIICFFDPKLGQNHNHGWQRVCILLGGNGERCHALETTPARKTRKFEYTTTLGHKVKIGLARHRKIQNGSRYFFKSGIIDRNCKFTEI